MWPYLLTVVVICVISTLWKEYQKGWKRFLAIPGPPAYPIIGHLLQMLKPQDDLFRYCREKSLQYFPIYKEWAFWKRVVYLTSPEDIKLILTSNKHLKKYELLFNWLGTGLLTSDGAKWHYRRKLITPAFHLSVLQKSAQVFNEKTKKLLENITKESSKNETELTRILSEFAFDCIKEQAMGSSSILDEISYMKNINAIGKIINHRLIRPWLYQKEFYYRLTHTGKLETETVQELHNFTNSMIQEKSNNMQDNPQEGLSFLDLLLQARHKKQTFIDDEGIREEVDTYLFEGHDTTSTALGYILMLLANHPNIQDCVYEEFVNTIGEIEMPKYEEYQCLNLMERCIKEALRLYPSIPLIARRLTHDVETYSGYTIPTDSLVIMQIYDMHRNPNLFPNPEKFDPDRFLSENCRGRHPFAYIPFSAGHRNCIGQKLAMLKLKVTIGAILRKFVLEAVDTPNTVKIISGLVLKPINGISVRFIKRPE